MVNVETQFLNNGDLCATPFYTPLTRSTIKIGIFLRQGSFNPDNTLWDATRGGAGVPSSVPGNLTVMGEEPD